MIIYKDIEQYFETMILDNNGNFISGLDVNYIITRDIDDTLVVSGTSSESNGVYYFKHTFNDVGSYRLKYLTPDNYENGFKQIIVENDNDTVIINNIQLHRQETEDRIKYILGLSQQNFRIFDQVYNENNLLISSTIKIYDNPTDCSSDINHLKRYSMDASYDTYGRVISYKVIES